MKGTKFSQWLEEAGNELRPEQFPSILAVIGNDVRYEKWFRDQITLINNSLQTGSIPNPRYKDLKFGMSRKIEQAWEKSVSEPHFFGGKIHEYPEELKKLFWGMMHVDFQNYKKIERETTAAAKKHGDHPAVKAVLSLLSELKPLIEAIIKLKDMAVKRAAPDPNDPSRKPGYIPPRVLDSQEMQKVHDMLKQITDTVAEEYKKHLSDYFIRIANNYLAIHGTESRDWRKRIIRNPYDAWGSSGDAHIAEMLVQFYEKSDNPYIRKELEKPVLKADHQAIAMRKAESIATETQAQFIAKNLAKLVSIITEKAKQPNGGVKSQKVTDASASANGIQGWMRFEFDDGSSFNVQNQAVWSTNEHGTSFLRFPTTFHDVVMPDGKKMPVRTSEEAMNTVFVGKNA